MMKKIYSSQIGKHLFSQKNAIWCIEGIFTFYKMEGEFLDEFVSAIKSGDSMHASYGIINFDAFGNRLKYFAHVTRGGKLRLMMKIKTLQNRQKCK